MSRQSELAQLGRVFDNSALSNRNKLINGSMVIDQRNGGGSVTPDGSSYTLDRWRLGASAASKVSVQQSSVAPEGFSNSALITSVSAYTMGAIEEINFGQRIEGYNASDLGWGTASAKAVTLSFWVRSSLTGLFSGAVKNADGTRSYAFTYSINAANTWEYKSVTIQGDTSGTWAATNSTGVIAQFMIAAGSSLLTTANTWSSGNYAGATGATNLVATNGATIYITGVQLEVGDTATPFEHRSYGQELALCQRYYQKYVEPRLRGVHGGGQSAARMGMTLPVIMRVAPSVTLSGTLSVYDGGTSAGITGILASYTYPDSVEIDGFLTATLTTGRALVAYKANGGSYLSIDAEL